uniref:Ribosomal protein S9 n=1 Tax=Cyanophora biloba TaxID=1489483 RepID=A0A2Z4HGG3_9EUKA|nr:ribosomal protein S9 [Cyanophora biloba]AWW13838.1 ribosomal protein S9 [Cyanophora biloba]
MGQKQQTLAYGTGRRKTSVAKVRLVSGKGIIVINSKPADLYLQYNLSYLAAVNSPLETLGLKNDYDVIVNTQGGGLTGQSEAIKLGLARALCQISLTHRSLLKSEHHLTRDPRAKERKKYGLHKARKAPQYSKR